MAFNIDIYLDRDSFPLVIKDVGGEFKTIIINIKSAAKYKFNMLFIAFKKQFEKEMGFYPKNKRLILMMHGMEYIKDRHSMEQGENCILDNELTLKHLGSSRYLELQYKFKQKVTFEDVNNESEEREPVKQIL